MEKRNTLLLTVIAIATLLVAVVGATFAYFAQGGSYDNTANLTANTAAASSTFLAEGKEISLNVTAASMVQANNGTVADSNTVSDAIKVSFTSGGENLSCSYDIYYKWTSHEQANGSYVISSGSNIKEFTYTITKSTDSGQASAFGSETNFVDSDTADHLIQPTAGTKQTITNASATTPTVDHYNITVKFYNLNQDQSIEANNQSGKHWSIQFGVKNVIC